MFEKGMVESKNYLVKPRITLGYNAGEITLPLFEV
jgi:hypothetical protein